MTNGLDGRIQSLPRVAVRGAPPSVASRLSATGCNGRRRSEDVSFFFSLPQKRIWADGFFEGCDTAMLPCFFFLFSFFFLGSGFAFWDLEILLDGSNLRYKRCAQMSRMLDRRDFGKGIPMKRSPRSRFLMFWSQRERFPQTFTGWFQRLLIACTSGKWLPEDRLQYDFCGG